MSPPEEPMRDNRFEYKPPAREPFFNAIPPVILWLVGAIVLAHVIAVVYPQIYLDFLIWGAVSNGPLQLGSIVINDRPMSGVPSLFLHVFLHADWLHLGLNVFILLATANAAARPFGSGPRGIIGFLLFFFACAAAGAAFHTLLQPSPAPMIGASTGVSGMIAAAGWAIGGRQGAMQFVMPWLLINLGMALFDTAFGLPISWAGHIGGLLAGAILYPTFVRHFFSRRR